MPSDLRWVEKNVSACSHERLLRKCWKLVFLASEFVRSPSKINPGVFLASLGTQIYRKLTFAVFRSNCVKHDKNPPFGSKKMYFSVRLKNNAFFDPIPDRNHIHLIWIEKSADGDLLQPGVWRSGKHPQIDLGRDIRRVMRRESPISVFFRDKSSCERADFVFSTDCKSDGIIIGLLYNNPNPSANIVQDWLLTPLGLVHQWLRAQLENKNEVTTSASMPNTGCIIATWGVWYKTFAAWRWLGLGRCLAPVISVILLHAINSFLFHCYTILIGGW